MNDINRILAVCRATKYCDKAVHYGISLAKQNGAKLYVLHVFDDPFGLEAWSLPVVSWKQIQKEYKRMQQKTRIDIDKIIEGEQSADMAIEVTLKDGHPAEKILDFVKENKIDLLIMLAHEEGRLEYLLFGHSIDKIIRKLPCTVLLVKQEPGRAG
ncbi:MAG: universal stress protein [Deltaproteobacteria bacterium]